MFIFWKGKTMVDYRDDNAKYGNEETNRENGYGENKYGENGHNGCGSNCGCECCQCKRIFMMLVVLFLVFIAGIMVGNCGTLPLCGQLLLRSECLPGTITICPNQRNFTVECRKQRRQQIMVAAKTRPENSPGAKRQGYPDGQAYQTARCIRMDRPTRMGSLILEIRLIRTGKLADLSQKSTKDTNPASYFRRQKNLPVFLYPLSTARPHFNRLRY